MKNIIKRYHGEWHNECRILFPGYVFVDTDDKKIEEVQEGLHSIIEFTKLIGTGTEICPVTYEEERFLISMMDKEHVIQKSIGFLLGDEVEIIEGPLAHVKGSITHINRHKREAVLEVNLFGGINKMTVSLEVMRKMNEEECNLWMVIVIRN